MWLVEQYFISLLHNISYPELIGFELDRKQKYSCIHSKSSHCTKAQTGSIENGYRDSCVLHKIYLVMKFSDKSCNFSVVGTHLVITGIVS